MRPAAAATFLSGAVKRRPRNAPSPAPTSHTNTSDEPRSAPIRTACSSSFVTLYPTDSKHPSPSLDLRTRTAIGRIPSADSTAMRYVLDFDAAFSTISSSMVLLCVLLTFTAPSLSVTRRKTFSCPWVSEFSAKNFAIFAASPPHSSYSCVRSPESRTSTSW